jgi:hypothetical protein
VLEVEVVLGEVALGEVALGEKDLELEEEDAKVTVAAVKTISRIPPSPCPRGAARTRRRRTRV